MVSHKGSKNVGATTLGAATPHGFSSSDHAHSGSSGAFM